MVDMFLFSRGKELSLSARESCQLHDRTHLIQYKFFHTIKLICALPIKSSILVVDR